MSLTWIGLACIGGAIIASAISDSLGIRAFSVERVFDRAAAMLTVLLSVAVFGDRK